MVCLIAKTRTTRKKFQGTRNKNSCWRGCPMIGYLLAGFHCICLWGQIDWDLARQKNNEKKAIFVHQKTGTECSFDWLPSRSHYLLFVSWPQSFSSSSPKTNQCIALLPDIGWFMKSCWLSIFTTIKTTKNRKNFQLKLQTKWYLCANF